MAFAVAGRDGEARCVRFPSASVEAEPFSPEKRALDMVVASVQISVNATKVGPEMTVRSRIVITSATATASVWQRILALAILAGRDLLVLTVYVLRTAVDMVSAWPRTPPTPSWITLLIIISAFTELSTRLSILSRFPLARTR